MNTSLIYHFQQTEQLMSSMLSREENFINDLEDGIIIDVVNADGDGQP